MEEKEAETVLMALGPTLEWRRFASFWLCDSIAGDAASCYKVDRSSENDQLPFRAVYHPGHLIKPPGDYGPAYYQTLDLAKIACERHYATGRWM